MINVGGYLGNQLLVSNWVYQTFDKVIFCKKIQQ